MPGAAWLERTTHTYMLRCASCASAESVASPDEPTLVLDHVRDAQLSSILCRQREPSDFAGIALKMVLVMKRRVEASKAAKKLHRRSRTGLPSAAIMRTSRRMPVAALGSASSDPVLLRETLPWTRKSARDGQDLLDQRCASRWPTHTRLAVCRGCEPILPSPLGTGSLLQTSHRSS